MKSFLSKWPITCIAGILNIMVNFIFMTVAYILFPGAFNIFIHTASTLGNHSLNPIGAIIFRIGNIIGGALLFPFFLGLYKWKQSDKWSTTFLYCTIILGCIMGFAFIMFGVFSQEYNPYHLIWAGVFFLASGTTSITGGLFLLKHTDSIRSIAFFNFISAALHSTIILFLTHGVVIIEWIIILIISINMVLLIYNYKQMSQANT